MASDSLHLAIERATYLAWAITGFGGFCAGALLFFVFGRLARLTKMRLVSGMVVALIALVTVVLLDWVRYRIAEAPFEPPAWIDPGAISKLLPLAALIAGFLLVRAVTRQVAAR